MQDIKAVLFDMDGVLVDSEPVILEAAMRGLAEYGVTAQPEDFVPFIGAGEDRFIGGVAQKYGKPYQLEMKKRVYDIYDTIVDDKIKVYKDVTKTLQTLRDKGYKLALTSSADRRKVLSNLKAAKIPTALFDLLLSADEVTNKKPDPEVYLLAAKELGLPNAQCVVVEDAVNGVKAGQGAGSKTIGLTTTFSREIMVEAAPDVILGEMSEILKLLA